MIEEILIKIKDGKINVNDNTCGVKKGNENRNF